jgi:hypothetical protein
MDERHAELVRMITECRVTQAIHVAATLGIADLLADGPRSSDELADSAGADPDALYRLLRALASVGVFREEEGRRFALTPFGEYLRTDVPDSLHGRAAFIGRPYFWQAWGHLLHSVRTGENAFHDLHGQSVWDYREENPYESAIFDRTMASTTFGDLEPLLAAYDLGRFETIVDIGGGNGALLSALLQRYPQMQGVVFDQPAVVERAEEPLRAAGTANRCRLVGGSFFESVPGSGDAYILKHIIHDWEDEDSTRILQVVRGAIPDNGVVLLIEADLGPPNEAPASKFADLNMLVLPGGRERTLDEYGALLESAGFRLERATPTSSSYLVIEGVPVVQDVL